MPAGKWIYDQKLTKGQYVVTHPEGPMELDGNEVAIWLGAWITQRQTGATQWTSTNTFTDETYWTAPTGYRNGNLTAGPAMGLTLLATHNTVTGKNAFYFWPDQINLVD